MTTRRLLNRLAEHIAYIERRESRKLSNRQIAEDTGLSRTTVDAYINNDRIQYDINNVLKLCDYLSINPETDFWVVEEVKVTPDNEGQRKTPLAAA